MFVRLALLDASVGETPAADNFRREFGVDLDVFKVSDGELPRVSAEDGFDVWPYDGVVVSGSQTSVYWDEPWISEVAAWVADAVEAGVPVLGVCWGHQLLARALGGAVADMGEYELGYEEIRLVVDDPLFEGFTERFVAFETHSDEVTELPPGATLLAENDTTVQAFRVNDAYGVQFHPEYDLRTARWVTEAKRGALSDERVDAVLADVTATTHERSLPAKRIFANFERIVTDRSRRLEV